MEMMCQMDFELPHSLVSQKANEYNEDKTWGICFIEFMCEKAYL